MTRTNNSKRLAEIRQQIESLENADIFGTKKEIKYLPEVLDENETIKGVASGMLENNTWLIVCTDQRVLFLDKGMLYGLKQKEIPLDSISSVTHKTGIMLGSIEVLGSGHSGMKIKQIEKKCTASLAKSIMVARRELLGQ